MATLHVSLPEQLEDWVETQARSGHYADAGDYVRDLIRNERRKLDAQAELERLIDEGFESGISERSMDEVLETARSRARALLGG